MHHGIGTPAPGRQAEIRQTVDNLMVADRGDTVLLNIRTSDYRLSEVMFFVEQAQQRFPRHEIFMDGDAYAFVARARGC